MVSTTAAPPPRGISLMTRLSAIMAFLALLPVLGVVIGIVGLQANEVDDAALDHAASGTINLERINGLVYAITMESRGIYMSPDWSAAEKFADNLTKQLSELQQLIPAWQQDAIASQEANVDEVTRRIEEFIRFRTELVRLARVEGPPAARVFGDNAANRAVRSALNESLEMLARAYQQDMERLRAEIEAGDRQFMWGLGTLAAVATLALWAGFVVIRRSLLRPLLRLRGRILQLATGDYAAAFEWRQGAAEIGDMARAVEMFRIELIDRQRLNRETKLLSALNVWLQSCSSLHELYDMIAAFLAKLLPTCPGSLFIYANSRDVLESAKAWNGGRIVPTMQPEDCWALRRGRAYTYGEEEIAFVCTHVGADHAERYSCIPILAHGETIGLFHLEFPDGERTGDAAADDALMAEQRRLAIACAEQISLAIANVKLRDRLRDQSIRDPLTGLYNRRYLLETCRREFARAVRTKSSVGMLSLDIDNFKKFNDDYGHEAGDLVLREVGNSLETMFRTEDLSCRFGGDEFVVVLPGADTVAAVGRAENLRSRIEALTVRYLDQDLPRITISVGVAAFPGAGDTPEATLKAADDALYRAKAHGRNRVEPPVPSQTAELEATAPPPALSTAALEPASDGALIAADG